MNKWPTQWQPPGQFSGLETDLMQQSTFRLGEIQRQAEVIREAKAVLARIAENIARAG